MSAPLRILHGLPFVSVTLHANGQQLTLERVLVDTGSGGTVFKTDDLKKLGVLPSPTDRLRFLKGIGGEEAVIEKQIDAVEVATLSLAPFRIQMGAVEYGLGMDGILGADFLLRAKAVVDFDVLQLRAAAP